MEPGQRVRIFLRCEHAVLDRRLDRGEVAAKLPAAPAQVGNLFAGLEPEPASAPLDDRLLPFHPTDQVGAFDLDQPLPDPVAIGPFTLAVEQVDMGGAAGRADRELGQLRAIVGGRQDRPVPGEEVGQRQASVNVGLRVVGDQDQRVPLEEAVDAAPRLDQRRHALVGAGDRLDRRFRPVAVRVVVVVGEREEHEVERVVADQLGSAAGRVRVAAAGDRGRLAGNLAARVEVAVEELLRAVRVVAKLQPADVDRAAEQPVERDLMAVAAAVDQERRAGGAGAGVVEALEQGVDIGV